MFNPRSVGNWFSFLLIVTALCPWTGWAQDPSGQSASDKAVYKDLARALTKLEKEFGELRNDVNQLACSIQKLPVRQEETAAPGLQQQPYVAPVFYAYSNPGFGNPSYSSYPYPDPAYARPAYLAYPYPSVRVATDRGWSNGLIPSHPSLQEPPQGARPEEVARAPIANENREPMIPSVSYLTNNDYRVAYRDGHVEGFQFETGDPAYGLNSPQYGRFSRQWDFYMPGEARQDMRLEVFDGDESHDSHSPEASIYFFPRKFVPAIREHDGILDVVLPTGERVQYDAKSKKIIGGALKENPYHPSPEHPVVPIDIQYTGSGVMLKMTAHAIAPEDSTGEATISKKGHRDCHVPISQVVEHNGQRLHFRFATDQKFDQFLRAKCGFSIN